MAFTFSCSDLSVATLIAIFLLTLAILSYFLKSLMPKVKVGDLENKYVLITGCDSGFGKDVAIQLDRLGFHVIATCLTNSGKENLLENCSERVVGILMDVTDARQIQKVYQQVRELLPREKGLWADINNAGYLIMAPLEWIKIEDFKKSADINLWGMIDVTKTFLPLVKTAKGRIVNVSSVAGMVSKIGAAPYAITKYGVEAFSDALRREMVPWSVKVCIIEPQPFKTTIFKDVTGKRLEGIWDGISHEMKREYGFDYPEKFRKRVEDYVERRASTETHLVVDAIIDAVTSRDPCHRYRCGWNAKYTAFLAVLPTSLQDFALNLL